MLQISPSYYIIELITDLETSEIETFSAIQRRLSYNDHFWASFLAVGP